LKRKDLIVNKVAKYMDKFKGREQCFNNETFFPFSYRLYRTDECKEFFRILNSEAYKTSLAEEPIQYLIKVGYGAHRAKGVYLLDQEQTAKLKKKYGSKGSKCGKVKRRLIAQTYVTNPLLLDMNNKFDFRVYMLVASTNPLIAYYHDGFLRVSLHTYDKFSNDRSTHLTNTHLSKKTFAEAKDHKINNMTEQELRDYQMWDFERLEAYLLESGKISDPNWVNNTLRPMFKKAFIHTVRMSAASFWKGSNVFEMFGLDFMLDDKFNLWFIECNASPQLIGTNPKKTEFLSKMLRDLFEIQYSLYRGRMTRLAKLLEDFMAEKERNPNPDLELWHKKYEAEMVNRFDPQFPISKDNSFEIIIDETRKGADVYMGYLDPVCAAD